MMPPEGSIIKTIYWSHKLYQASGRKLKAFTGLDEDLAVRSVERISLAEGI